MQRANKPDMMLEIWLPFKSNNADGKRIIAHQLRLALPPSGRGSIRYPPEEAGHPDRRTEAQVGTRSPVNLKPRRCVSSPNARWPGHLCSLRPTSQSKKTRSR
ncbi:hypothetical protein BDV41DRAFT_382489 [Aspergillus transmontanensis]|uniref:Uncharacterized protein n=1 Tax=Aspergillus transmontanensis TaxID=1034304 RepID=A0A5N6WCN3_9EURO|nr:hypothetical protein BDV41DRAFT_382489 [Aspergillus transmontanensis]